MQRRLAAVLLIGLVATICAKANAKDGDELVSPWLRNMEIPAKIRRQIASQADALSKQGYYHTVFRRTVSYLPSITRNADRMGVSPWPAIGITEFESSGRIWAVDYLSMAGKAKTTHGGIGQLSEALLPRAVRNDPKRLACQRRYLQTHKQADLAAWARRDPRFDPKWASRAICYGLRRNTEQTGHSTLGVQCHNSGLRGQQNTLVSQAAAWDQDIRYWGASAFVEKEGLNYFILLNQKGTTYRSWQSKGENHAFYCFKVAVRQEAFARWVRRNQGVVSRYQMAMLFPGNGQPARYLAKQSESKKVVVCSAKNKPVAASAVSVQMDKDVSGTFKEGTMDKVVTILSIIYHALGGMVHQLFPGLSSWEIRGVIALIALVFVAGLRHIVPATSAFVWFRIIVGMWRSRLRILRGVADFLTVLFGSRRQRKRVHARIRATSAG